jgi:putative membrane protein insertion efficiency factor
MHRSPALKPITWPPSTNDTASATSPHRGQVAAAVVVGLLRAYKLLISPLFTGCCRFYPSCSDYMREAVIAHGAVRGVSLGLRRLARCHPWGSHGFDPCPPAASAPTGSPER